MKTLNFRRFLLRHDRLKLRHLIPECTKLLPILDLSDRQILERNGPAPTGGDHSPPLD
ncbi:hypothetical protein [Limnoraphis robusta]|uniref:hypothetical protein n=1 Tax=Limnoraphis robusta TaxID=1118279 RepID=UPI0013649002|nr:hypothetical protein [Limnoraphis robusta]